MNRAEGTLLIGGIAFLVSQLPQHSVELDSLNVKPLKIAQGTVNALVASNATGMINYGQFDGQPKYIVIDVFQANHDEPVQYQF